MSTDVLVVGGGGREHAIAWKLAQSPDIGDLHLAPGNPGTAEFAENHDVGAEDLDALVQLALDESVELVVVGPEVPLAEGIADRLKEHNIAVFGPSKEAAKIEGSKAFSKDLMAELDVPTASYGNFTDYETAKAYLHEQGAPIVVKASGLAAGKGAIVCETMEEADVALKELMVDGSLGEAGAEVVIEEYLEGPEISIHVISDGENYVVLPPSQDHKPVGEGNTGPNTGGMGTVAPLPGVSEALMQRIDEEIVAPIIKGMNDAGTPYVGLLYPGIMLTKDGPKVLEFNCRFGDPETQSYMRLMDDDLLDIMHSAARGDLGNRDIKWLDKTAVNIVLASGGYPGAYEKGIPIKGVAVAENDPDVVVFHAGTKLADGELQTSGGRVLGVTAVGDDLEAARAKAYAMADEIDFDGKLLRKDIGHAHDNNVLANF